MPNGNISLLLQYCIESLSRQCWQVWGVVWANHLGLGEKKIQLLCFSPVSLKARTLESQSGTPMTKKWCKHPAKENNFFCLEVLKLLTLITSHFVLCLNSLPLGGCFQSVCVPACRLSLRSRSPASAWKGIQQETLSNKFLIALIRFWLFKRRKQLESSFLCKQRRGDHWNCPDRVTLVRAV